MKGGCELYPVGQRKIQRTPHEGKGTLWMRKSGREFQWLLTVWPFGERNKWISRNDEQEGCVCVAT